MENLNQFGLRENPFPLVPGAKVTNWAGREEVRRRLVDVAESVLSTDTGLSEFVIIHGSYGAGKTHALRYLATLINETDAAKFRSRAIYMPKVRVGPKLNFLELYFQIIQELGQDYIRDIAAELESLIDTASRGLANQHDRDEERELREQDPQFFEKQVVEALPAEDRAMVRLLRDIAMGHEQQVFTYLGEGKPPVQGSDFSQPITTDYMAVQVLSALFRAMTISIVGQEPIRRGVHLLIDEVEEVWESKATEQVDLWHSIRELINRLPYNFALLLAFSAEAAMLEAIMPTAIAERISRQNIELHALSLEEAKEFIRKQISDFRLPGFVPPQPYYPFSEETIDFVLEQIVILVPRKIFRALRTVLERAIRRNQLQQGEEIDIQMAEEIVVSAGI